ncbi:MAG: sigma 54-interacting transcriptional regulator [Candidatus Binatia bacterium]|nr:sigma 54-interacting transcriptional regulator [Candidatus Binatia bacterium]
MTVLSPRVVRTAVLVLTLAGLGMALFSWTQGMERIGQPWPGFGILPNGEVGPSLFVPLALQQGKTAPRFQERVTAVNGHEVDSAAQVEKLLQEIPVGAPVRYRLESPKRAEREVTLPAAVLSSAEWQALFLPLLIGGVVGLLVGAVPALARPDLVATQIFFLLNLGLSTNFGFATFDYFVAHELTPWTVACGALASGSLMLFGLMFPSRIGPARAHAGITAAAVYALNAAYWVVFAVALMRNPQLLRTLDFSQMILFQTAALMIFGNFVWSAGKGPDQITRQQARVVLVSLAITAPGGLLFSASVLGLLPFHLPLFVYLLPLWLLGALLVYSMIAHNLFDLDSVVRRGLTAAVIAAGAIAVQLVLLATLSRWTGSAVAWAVSGTTTLLLVAAITAAIPLRQNIEDLVERVLFPRLAEARVAVHEASRQLVRTHGEADIARVLREAASRSVAARSARLVTGPAGGELKELSPLPGSEAIVLPSSDPLHALIRRGTSTNFQTPRPGRRAPAKSAATRAEELSIALSVPLPPNESRVGALLLGTRTDGRLHTRDDEILLETLAAQTVAALENARAWSAVQDLEKKLRAENVYLREEIDLATDTGGEMIGRSPALKSVLAQLERVAPTDAAVLVQGETGTGKELLVRMLHEHSKRAGRMLVKVACAALPDSLVESELFGFERGAFTGATNAKPGRFEIADGGTLFLDDVDTLPQGAQAKLLRALQEGEVQRLGSNQVRQVDVRLVAATNRDLIADVRAGRFREDLYYRLNVFPLQLPSLRERIEDIPRLVEHFIREESPRLGREVKSVASESLEILQRHQWPGNIRELRNVIQRALVLSDDEVLRVSGPLDGSAAPGRRDVDESLDGIPLAEQVRMFKRRVIRGALDKAGGNQRVAAEMLGMHRQSLTRMIRDLGLQEPGHAARRS